MTEQAMLILVGKGGWVRLLVILLVMVLSLRYSSCGEADVGK